MKTNKISICLLTYLIMTSLGNAEMLWGSFSLSYLKGNDYEVGDSNRQVLTVEHASGHNWGDNFFFMDRLKSENGSTSTYFELAPRISLSYLTDHKLGFSIIKDLYIATTWESSSAGFDNYLYGFGVALNVPGFKYINTNLYIANNDTANDDSQLTITWGLPFKISQSDFLYDGFLDWSSSSDTNASELNFTSQLKWNLSKYAGTKSPLYIGIEYAYWRNKFGIQGVVEKNPCLLVKWHF